MNYPILELNIDPNGFYDFGSKQFAITYKVGRLKAAKRRDCEAQATSRTERVWATGADLSEAWSVLKAFKHEVLSQILGKNWHKQTTDWFFWESYPETKGRNSWENTNLHFHTTLSGSAIAKLSIEKLDDICQKASNKIGFRLFGWNPGVDVQEVKSLDAWRAYTMKNQHEMKTGFGGVTLMSDNMPRLNFARTKGSQMH